MTSKIQRDPWGFFCNFFLDMKLVVKFGVQYNATRIELVIHGFDVFSVGRPVCYGHTH